MAHNMSRRRLDEIQRQRTREDLAPYQANGWQLSADLSYEEVPTILGAWQRKQTATSHCRSPECSRRCDIDLRAAIDAGLAQERVIELVRHLRCSHWRGCAIKPPQLTYPRGVPLIAYITDRNALVEISCAKCSDRHAMPPRRVIDKLVQTQKGNSATGVNDIGSRIRGPCRKCGARQFTARYVWPNQTQTN